MWLFIVAYCLIIYSMSMTHVMALHTETEHNLQILFASFRLLAFECLKSIRMCVRVINHILLLILLLLHFPFICSPFLVSADGCFSLILFSAHFSQNINAIWKLDLSKMVINFLATKWQFRTKGRHTHNIVVLFYEESEKKEWEHSPRRVKQANRKSSKQKSTHK